jgi:hypothetical protein
LLRERREEEEEKAPFFDYFFGSMKYLPEEEKVLL